MAESAGNAALKEPICAARSPLHLLPAKIAMTQLYGSCPLTHGAEIDLHRSRSVERSQGADAIAQSSEENRELGAIGDISTALELGGGQKHNSHTSDWLRANWPALVVFSRLPLKNGVSLKSVMK